jgi:2-dehydro-3-deoxyphosphogluconate aldolase/(4S)-4-hydroxy-2-oxoglutarate aldolase
MDKRSSIISTLVEQGLMPLYYNADEQKSVQLMHALYEAGIRLIEYTNRGEAALANFTAMKKAAETLPGLYLGVGTIKTDSAAQTFIDAGADFLISPALAEEVYEAAYTNKVLWIPGCMTPTEILKAEQFGVGLVKLFPGNVLGPSFVQAVKELFPQMKFMPTGGVDTSVENLSAWFKAGVTAVGMGSKLISKEVMEAGSYSALQEQAANLLATIQSIKN